MKPRDFRIGWRALAQEPVYSSVVVFGLAIGVAACLLLLGFVRYSFEYDAHVPHGDNVYVVKQRHNVAPLAPWYDLAPLFLRAAATNASELVEATGYLPSRPQWNGQDGKLTARVDGKLQLLHSLTVLPGFAETLGLQTLRGSIKAALEQPENFAITEAAAIRLFGTADVVGRTVHVEGKLLRAGAVLRTPPANSTIPFEALLGVNTVLVDAEFRHQVLTGEQGWWGKLLIRVKPGASLPAITAALQQAVDNSASVQKIEPEMRERLGKRKVMEIALSPLRSAYFNHEVSGNFTAGPGKRANPAVIAGVGAIAILILALAAINYVNLATVRVLRRQREIAMRKVLGAGVPQIVLQFLAESIVVSVIATGIGLLLAWMALPLFSELVDRQLDGMLSPSNIGAAIAISGLLGALTAVYPTWIAIRVHPSQALAERQNTESRTGMRIRRALTVVQISIAMGLASMTLAVAWQTEFAMQAPPGFDPAPLLIVDLLKPVKYSKPARAFIAALSAQPAVAGVAISEDAVGRKNMSWSRELRRPGGTSASMDMKSVSANFFEQYRIKPQAGRLFDPRIDKDDDAVPVILNAIAARELGFATPSAALGQTVQFTGFDNKIIQKRIVGIAPDLRFNSLRVAPRATAYELLTAGTTLSVRAAVSPAEAERVIQALWPKYFEDTILTVQHAQDMFAQNYAEDARTAKLLAIATGIALVIAALGTYVLSAHTVQRRATEIALRKLHGARRFDIGLIVVREIGGLIAIASLIGLPLAALGIQRYLASYVEHAPIGYWTLLLALAATLAIAAAAVARHAWIAMRMMPAAALRT